MTAEPDAVVASPDRAATGSAAARRDAPVVLAVRDLRKRYGELEAVKGVSFQIHEGETYGLLGPNGAGKTTTISMVCGLLDPRCRRGDPGRPGDRRGRRRRQGGDRVRAPGAGDLPRPDRPREPRVLRPAVRPRRRAAQGADERGPRAHRPHRAGQGPHLHLQRRHAAPAQHRHRAAAPAAPAAPRRAHRGRRPAEPQRDPGVRRRAGPAGHGDPVHDPLHGGGRASLHADRDHRRRRDPGRGNAQGAGGPDRAAGPGPPGAHGRRRGGGREPRDTCAAWPRRRPRATRSRCSPRTRAGSCPGCSTRSRLPGPTCGAWRSSSRTSRPSSSISPAARSATPSSDRRPRCASSLLVALKDLRQRLRDRTGAAGLGGRAAGTGLHLQPAPRRRDRLPRRLRRRGHGRRDAGDGAARGCHRLARGQRRLPGHGRAHRGRGTGRRGGWHGRCGIPDPGRVQRGHRRGPGGHAGGRRRPGCRARDGDRPVGRAAASATGS